MKSTYLKWWLLNATVFSGCVIAAYFGVFKDIYQKDYSYLCFVIMAIYVIFSFWNGWHAYEFDSKGKAKHNALEPSWFMSEICLSLGMIGTVIGFIGMLQGFSTGIDGTKAIQKMMSNMSYGMSTALYTTLAGLIFGNLLKLQCFQIERAIEAKNVKA